MEIDKKCNNCEHCRIAGNDAYCNQICEPTSEYDEACEDGEIKIPDGASIARRIYNMCQARIEAGHGGEGYKAISNYIKFIICEPYGIKLKEE